MRLPRVPRWVWVPVVAIAAPILLIVAGEAQKFIVRQNARFDRFNTFDPATTEKMMVDMEIPEFFSNRDEMLSNLYMIKVPGYGSSGKPFVQPDGSVIWFESIEIPGRGKDRGVVFREVNGRLNKLDDFVYNTEKHLIFDVQIDGDTLSYVDTEGRAVPVNRTRPK
jgi:hypothetical protein